MKTTNEIKNIDITELENKVIALEFFVKHVAPIIEKYDGKKPTKHMSSAIKKKIDQKEISYIGDLSYETFWNNRMLRCNIYFGFEADGKKWNQNLELELEYTVTDGKGENFYNHAKTLENIDYQLNSTKNRLEKLESFNEDKILEYARKADELLRAYKELGSSLTYEQKKLVAREMRESDRYVQGTFQD